MVLSLEHRARVARSAWAAAARLQVGACAEAAPRAGHQHASHAAFRILDLAERLHQPAEHLGRNRVHDLGMVEGYDSDWTVDVEFCAFEFHGSLRLVVTALMIHYPN